MSCESSVLSFKGKYCKRICGDNYTYFYFKREVVSLAAEIIYYLSRYISLERISLYLQEKGYIYIYILISKTLSGSFSSVVLRTVL